MNETLKLKLANLPLEPGCYMMKDKHGEIIYVGKAKKLKNRVNSYFTGAHNYKTTKLVSQIVDFDIIPMLSEYWFDDNTKLQKWENILHGVFQ